MRVIRAGSGNIEDKTFQLECRKDKTIVHAKFTDLKLVADPRDGDYYEWKCPCCGEKNTIAQSVLPDRVVMDQSWDENPRVPTPHL